MNYHPFGAGSPLPFIDTSDTNMDYAMDQSGHFNDNEQQQILQPQPPSFGHSPLGASSNTNQSLNVPQGKANDQSRAHQPIIATMANK
jgi:hypothetical protein